MISMKALTLQSLVYEVKRRALAEQTIEELRSKLVSERSIHSTTASNLAVARKELEYVRALRDRLSKEAAAARPKLAHLYEAAERLTRLGERLNGLPPNRKTRGEYRIAVARSVAELNRALHDAHEACGMIPF